ncbi:MAG: endolytic transglycosylase MltG [bacterium]|nr:endolytic transglycosylase MltG [bacterium]
MKTGNIIIAVLGAIFRVVIAVAAVFLIYKGALACYDYGYRIFTEPAMSSGEGRTVTVAITESMSASDIGELLENKGLVRDAKLFVIQYYLSEFRADVKPGVFELNTSMTAEEMMEAMTVSQDGAAEGDGSGAQDAGEATGDGTQGAAEGDGSGA